MFFVCFCCFIKSSGMCKDLYPLLSLLIANNYYLCVLTNNQDILDMCQGQRAWTLNGVKNEYKYK